MDPFEGCSYNAIITYHIFDESIKQSNDKTKFVSSPRSRHPPAVLDCCCVTFSKTTNHNYVRNHLRGIEIPIAMLAEVMMIELFL